MAEKLTLAVHPFWLAKYNVSKNGAAPRLSQEPFGGGQKDPVGELMDLGIGDPLAQAWGARLPAYCEAVERAADGTVIIIRSEQYGVHLELERLLFDHARKTVPKDRLLFFPDFDAGIAQEMDLPMACDGITSVSELIRKKCRGIERMRDVRLFAFGESAEVCVPDEVIKVHRRFDIAERASVLSPYTFSDSGAPAEQAIKYYLSRDREQRMTVVKDDSRTIGDGH